MPSSVADCMGNDVKFALRIADTSLKMDVTWNAVDSFARVDWDQIPDYGGTADFIRVEGKATAAQAGEVVAAIAKFRQRSGALVITNAVAIEGTDDAGEMEVSLEQIRLTIERALGKLVESLFAPFDHVPVAAASLAPVHLATLKDGTGGAGQV